MLQWLQLDADTQRQEIETSADLCSCLPETNDRIWVLNALVTGSEYDRNLMPSLVVLMRDNEMSQADMDIIAVSLYGPLIKQLVTIKIKFALIILLFFNVS